MTLNCSVATITYTNDQTCYNVYMYVAEFFPDRSEVQCLHRWQKVLNPELVKGPWTQKVRYQLGLFTFCNI